MVVKNPTESCVIVGEGSEKGSDICLVDGVLSEVPTAAVTRVNVILKLETREGKDHVGRIERALKKLRLKRDA